MTIDETIEQLESVIDTYEILLGNGVNSDILDVDDLEAIKVAIANLETWQKVRQDIQTETDDKSNNMYFNLGMLGALAIINKHLQEVQNNE